MYKHLTQPTDPIQCTEATGLIHSSAIWVQLEMGQWVMVQRVSNLLGRVTRVSEPDMSVGPNRSWSYKTSV